MQHYLHVTQQYYCLNVAALKPTYRRTNLAMPRARVLAKALIEYSKDNKAIKMFASTVNFHQHHWHYFKQKLNDD
jgi:hypothetical protein